LNCRDPSLEHDDSELAQVSRAFVGSEIVIQAIGYVVSTGAGRRHGEIGRLRAQGLHHKQTSGHFPRKVFWRQIPDQPRAVTRFCGGSGTELQVTS
jgi:hypothetical protein